MKKEFRAIAMQFNEQNWRDIVGKIESAGIKHNVWGGEPYLCNNWGGEHSPYIGNCDTYHSALKKMDKVYEEWDEAVFLEACGIDANTETFTITREQIRILADQHSWSESYLKQLFPKAFESEMEAGRWYKLPTFGKLMFMFTGGFGNDATYGFNYDGEFSETIGVQRPSIEDYVPATDHEVKEALIKEAKRRGLKQGVRVNDIYNGDRYEDTTTISSNDFDYERVPLGEFQDKMALRDSKGNILFVDGQWADVIHSPIELTIEDIAERFGVSVEQIKIKK